MTIRFNIYGYSGTFRNGFLAIDSHSSLGMALERQLQEAIDYEREFSPHKMAGANAMALNVLERWGVTIIQMPPVNDDPSVVY